jgi:hypothetical protein
MRDGIGGVTNQFDRDGRARNGHRKATPAVSVLLILRAIASLGDSPNTGLVLLTDVFTATRGVLDVIISLAAQKHVPTIYPFRFMAEAGGLISYGIDTADLYVEPRPMLIASSRVPILRAFRCNCPRCSSWP